ncbi:MAG: enoyl-[acyl-carrier-protein] reductase FabK [Proteobacteria bacterium]|jgi:enoyl-[acyl-carrier protein] reductase II|nr:enoyl-[acyl-carrier-protein] reductase FabK [Pseudomonadota bacterium]
MKTRITELLNIEYPILQGAMAWISYAPLVAAVSEAGGLGIIGGTIMTPNQLRDEIHQVRDLTDKPFGVNIISLSPWIAQILELLVEEQVLIATYGTGNPRKIIEQLKPGGVMSFPVVPSPNTAKRAQDDGADGVIVSGREGGGHVGDLTTMVLVPQARDVVDIPMVAAGGIGDARGMVAAFALGAEAIQMGTRFICTKEAVCHDNAKEFIVRSGPRDTLVTGNITGLPVRCLKNKMSQTYAEMESTGKPKAMMAMFGAGKMQQAFQLGDIEDGSVMAGQVCGLIDDVPTVAELIQSMMAGCDRVLDRLPR